MDNNLNENVMNNIKNLVDSGNISGAISQISPEMINNFSKLLSNNANNKDTSPNITTSINNSGNNTNSSDSVNNNSGNNKKNSGFDFSNIDMNTILKMKSVMEKMNNQDDPRSNLLSSLKPYLRSEKQEKLDQYATLLKMANVAELMRNDKKENNS